MQDCNECCTCDWQGKSRPEGFPRNQWGKEDALSRYRPWAFPAHYLGKKEPPLNQKGQRGEPGWARMDREIGPGQMGPRRGTPGIGMPRKDAGRPGSRSLVDRAEVTISVCRYGHRRKRGEARVREPRPDRPMRCKDAASLRCLDLNHVCLLQCRLPSSKARSGEVHG